MEQPVCCSHIGKRSNHEDNFLMDGMYLTSDEQKKMSENCCCFVTSNTQSRVRLFAVSDGMGGHNAGETASRICVEKLAKAEKAMENCSSVKEAAAHLQASIAEINTIVCEKGRRCKEFKGMGTTLVLFVICGTDSAILNIGDSRAYHFNNDTLIQITKDHTEGQRMLDLGLLTRKELSGFPAQKNLNRYIGYGQNGYVLQADEYYPVFDRGVLLLCSDGISDALSERRISEILHSEKNLAYACRQLANEAAAVPYADNATVMLIPLRR